VIELHPSECFSVGMEMEGPFSDGAQRAIRSRYEDPRDAAPVTR
jgi:hypothetical protein